MINMKYLNLIRYKNLFLIALMQFTFHYGFVKLQNIYVALNDWQFSLFVLSTILVAAAGYIINDIMDQEIDVFNKPDKVIVGKTITENTAYNLYFGLTISAMLIGFYLAILINKFSFAGLFVIYSVLLYLYATSFKKILFIGNFVVALVTSLSIISIGLFDVVPIIYPENKTEMIIMLLILLDYTIFAFVINFIREIVKDIEDIEGDNFHGIRTLSSIIGINKTTKIVFTLSLISVLVLLWYINTNLMTFKLYYATIYSLVFIVGPMVFFTIKIWNSKTKKDFHFLSNLLKWIIFFGILSVWVITLNIKYNA